ncbi:MAG: aldehyde dehydrogenase family protein, partial [Candidatus Thermoplasmatota archaeon]|nr:aldehyde dehydrogenase family protein [Candidatus Thermoplasmatota archaeon]
MIWKIEKPENDVNNIPSYAPGTPEREKLLSELEKLKGRPAEIPLIIGGKEVKTDNVFEIKCPHRKDVVLGKAHLAGEEALKFAIENSLDAHEKWANMDWYHRTAIFRKAADLLAGQYRTRHIAAIMMNHSKNPYEAEIDLAELVDFWNFNAYYARQIYEIQPSQYPGESNRTDWRPIEGFVFAVAPFNFYAIGGNLPSAPAIVGNVALWKPATSVIFSNYKIMKLLIETGLPAGIINFVPFPHKHMDVVLKHRDFAGLHFTGSYETFATLWESIGKNIRNYKNFPRVVGETGGKDFIFAHKSADPRGLAINIMRGAFEYQGQKCSAASRAYIPESIWPKVKKIIQEEQPKIKCGPV